MKCLGRGGACDPVYVSFLGADLMTKHVGHTWPSRNMYDTLHVDVQGPIFVIKKFSMLEFLFTGKNIYLFLHQVVHFVVEETLWIAFCFVHDYTECTLSYVLFFLLFDCLA